jgi:hypothetical protein
MDGKAVDAIEKLTGQTIPWIDKTAIPAQESPDTDARPEHTQRARGRGERSRRRNGENRPTASANRTHPLQPPRERRPHRDHDETPDMSHLPAFLLRPVTLKA